MAIRPFGVFELCRLLFTIALLLAVYLFLKVTVISACVYLVYRYLPTLYNSWLAAPIQPNDRGVFITGCDSGTCFALFPIYTMAYLIVLFAVFLFCFVLLFV